MDNDHDEVFFSLSQNVQRRIDKAFEAFLKDVDSERPKKKRKVTHTTDLDSGGGFNIEDDGTTGGGGFIVEDAAEDSGGGFMIEDGNLSSASGGGFLVDEEDTAGTSGGGGFIRGDRDEMEAASPKSDSTPDQIPFSSIPSALQFLDLPPDDEQVLNVFRNAASGWDDVHSKSSRSQQSRPTAADSEQVGLISREDWRAVCAILLEQQGGSRQEISQASSPAPSTASLTPSTRPATRRTSRRTTRGVTFDAQVLVDDSDEDQYQEEDGDHGDEKDEEYFDLEASASRRRRRQPTRGSASTKSRRSRAQTADSDISEYEDDEDDTVPGAAHKKSKPLTARQKEACLTAFALFFPDVDSDELPKKRIMLKDLQRVAGLLKEKIKAEEMVEMLEAFSTQPDKSMSLGDFEKMMVAAKLA